MAINVTVTPQVQEVEVSATVQPYEVQVEVIDSPILELTTIGTSGDATFDPFTGVLNIPNYSTDLSGVVPNSRTLTINGTAFDLSANRSWTVGDLLSSGSYSNPSWITSLDWSKIANEPTTLAGYGITDGSFSKLQALGSISGNVSINLSNGVIITATLTNAVTLSFTGLPAAGNEIAFSLRFAGIFQITFPVGTKFANDIAPTLEAPLYELPCSIDSAGNVIVYGAINKIDTI